MNQTTWEAERCEEQLLMAVLMASLIKMFSFAVDLGGPDSAPFYRTLLSSPLASLLRNPY